MLQRRHFEAIAREAYELGICRKDAQMIADVLCDFNPNFDRERFIHACLTGEMKLPKGGK